MNGEVKRLSMRVRRRARAASRWLRALAAVLDDLAGAGMDEFVDAGRRMALSRVTERSGRKRDARREIRR